MLDATHPHRRQPAAARRPHRRHRHPDLSANPELCHRALSDRLRPPRAVPKSSSLEHVTRTEDRPRDATPSRRPASPSFLPDEPAVAAVHVAGGAPASRETDLLRPGNLVERVDAIVFSGGSAFGLAAADGVMRWLAERGRGFEVAGMRVPIVPAARSSTLPMAATSRASRLPMVPRSTPRSASPPAKPPPPSRGIGSVGAGTGATTADLKGGFGCSDNDARRRRHGRRFRRRQCASGA